MMETLSFIFENQIVEKNNDRDILEVWGEEFLNTFTKPNQYFVIRKLESNMSNQFSEVLQDIPRIPDIDFLIQLH